MADITIVNGVYKPTYNLMGKTSAKIKIFLGNWWEMIWEMIWKTFGESDGKFSAGNCMEKLLVDMVIYGTFWGIAGKWYGKWDSKKHRHVKGSFLWHGSWELMGNVCFLKKHGQIDGLWETLTWDDMGTPVDNLWENWVEMVIYGKIYAKSLVNVLVNVVKLLR